MEHPAGCLHYEVNELIEKRIKDSEKVDVTDMTAKLAESLAEINSICCRARGAG
jgi:hypothetical protein